MADSAYVWCKGLSIHALRKESDQVAVAFHAEREISIHALRKESDVTFVLPFLPFRISIHALRKESDVTAVFRSSCSLHFNPRSP